MQGCMHNVWHMSRLRTPVCASARSRGRECEELEVSFTHSTSHVTHLMVHTTRHVRHPMYAELRFYASCNCYRPRSLIPACVRVGIHVLRACVDANVYACTNCAHTPTHPLSIHTHTQNYTCICIYTYTSPFLYISICVCTV